MLFRITLRRGVHASPGSSSLHTTFPIYVKPSPSVSFLTFYAACAHTKGASFPFHLHQGIKTSCVSDIAQERRGEHQMIRSLSTKTCPPPLPERAVGGYRGVDTYQSGKEDQKEEDHYGAGYQAWINLPFPPPFHTFNIVLLLILANIATYIAMAYLDDAWRDWIVEHFTLSHVNAHRLYPFLTSSFYQEHLLQLAIDVWLLVQFGKTMLGFLGGVRMAAFWTMCSLGGGLLHLVRQWAELAYGMDPIEVRGRCYGPNPFILGLVAVEGLIFRHLNFMQNPPVPFLVLTAFVMIIDVWRIFTTKPQEHGAATGGALMAYLFWRLPTRAMGLDRLTAAM